MNLDDDDDLAAELNAALDAQQPQRNQPLEEAPEGETPEQADERVYRRDGRRFVAKEEAKADDKAAATPDAAAKQEAAPKAWKPTWYKDEFGPWDKLAEPFRNALRDQERNAAQAIEKHSTAAKTWDPVNQALAPHAQELAAAGSSPQQYVGQLIEADKYLRASPVEALNWLCNQYLQCDVIALADWMHAQGHQPTKVDPVQQELAALKQQMAQLQDMPNRQKQEAINEQIRTWAKDKPDFAAVHPLMADIAKRNPQASLDEWYQQAQWATPEIRERILKEQEDKRLAELRGKRAAGAQSPRGGYSNGAAAKRPTMSIEEEIGSLLDGNV